MGRGYIEERNGGYYVAGTRVSLDSVVYNFRNGASPEKIAQSFPSLTLAQIYGAIAFYLDNKEHVDSYLERGEKEFEDAAPPLSQTKPALFEKLERARQDMANKRS